jgi:hypothetical protein
MARDHGLVGTHSVLDPGPPSIPGTRLERRSRFHGCVDQRYVDSEVCSEGTRRLLKRRRTVEVVTNEDAARRGVLCCGPCGDR